MRRRDRFKTAAFLLVGFVLLASEACWSPPTPREQLDAGILLMSLAGPLTPEIRRKLDLGEEIETTEDAIRYLLLEAVRRDEREYPAYAFLGFFLLSEKCLEAREYFGLYLDSAGDDPRGIDRVVTAIDEVGCEAVMNDESLRREMREWAF